MLDVLIQCCIFWNRYFMNQSNEFQNWSNEYWFKNSIHSAIDPDDRKDSVWPCAGISWKMFLTIDGACLLKGKQTKSLFEWQPYCKMFLRMNGNACLMLSLKHSLTKKKILFDQNNICWCLVWMTFRPSKTTDKSAWWLNSLSKHEAFLKDLETGVHSNLRHQLAQICWTFAPECMGCMAVLDPFNLGIDPAFLDRNI